MLLHAGGIEAWKTGFQAKRTIMLFCSFDCADLGAFWSDCKMEWGLTKKLIYLFHDLFSFDICYEYIEACSNFKSPRWFIPRKNALLGTTAQSACCIATVGMFSICQLHTLQQLESQRRHKSSIFKKYIFCISHCG